MAATDPLYILYTSGTTGKPKGIVRDNGGHAVALPWSMTNIFDIGPGEVIWAASDVGWVVGHSYIVYAPLLAGATTVLYEGKPVGHPGCRGVLAGDLRPPGRRRCSPRRPRSGRSARRTRTRPIWPSTTCPACGTLFLAGERLDPDTYQWATEILGIPVVDHWWQTETGWPICANLRGLEPMPIKPGSPTVPVPGYRRADPRPAGQRLRADAEGAICIKLPLPPGTLPTLWSDDERYVASYLSAFDGYYLTGDGGYIDADGYVFVMGRTDDVINVAGHRLSTGAMEAVLATHPAVAECAVIGVADELKGQVPRGFVVLKAGVRRTRRRCGPNWSRSVRDQIGAGGGLQAGRRGGRAAQDPFGQDPAQDHAAIADGLTSRCPRPSRMPRCSTGCSKPCAPPVRTSPATAVFAGSLVHIRTPAHRVRGVCSRRRRRSGVWIRHAVPVGGWAGSRSCRLLRWVRRPCRYSFCRRSKFRLEASCHGAS